LGLRDVIAAMSIQGDTFESVSDFAFESQFGEDTHAYISWGDYNNLVVYWTDRDGKEVRLALMGEGDVIDGLSISREN